LPLTINPTGKGEGGRERETEREKKQLVAFVEDIAETMIKFSEVDQAEITRETFSLVDNREIELL
jgi:hypothetical protein